MRNNLFVLFLVTLIMSSCSNPSPDIDKTLPVIKPIETSVTLESEAPATIIEATNPLPQIAPANSVALNPPHGEPGHDCNIAVGSPLKGAANSLNAAPVMPVMPSALNPVNNISTSGIRLNPPHGEPGHDCNVQVGQPLS